MIEKWCCVKPESVVRVGVVKTATPYFDTLSYIPGSVLRGAVAEWLSMNGREGDIKAFVENVRFGCFTPSSFKSISLPFPMSALECKRHGYFTSVPSGVTPGHGIRDLLLLSTAYFELKRQGVKLPVPLNLRCLREGCGGRLEQASGFYTRTKDGWVKCSVEKTVQTKVALSRHRRGAQEHALYSVVGIKPKGYFTGRIWVKSEEYLELVRVAVEEVGIGSLTTRGFGRVKLSFPSELSLPGVEERVAAFNSKLREVWSSLAELARVSGSRASEEPEYTYFSVDLLSPAIFRERGLPSLKLSLGGEFEPVLWMAQPAFVGGFSTAWGIPKPAELGACMGSVYVFRTKASEEEISPFLRRLEEEGVGERVDEGYGDVLICHPFHCEVMPV